MFEQAFKNIDNVLWKEAGCTTELDYTEQTSWLLFLKYLDGLEQDLADEAALEGKKYSYILDKTYRWDTWAAPKGILDEAFDGIATAKTNAENNVQNARAIFESYLQSVFTLRGEGWLDKRLEQIGTTQTGSTPKAAERGNYGDFIPFVKPGDFNKDGSLDYKKDGLSEKGLDEARKVAAGSVLMVCIGATIGKCGYCDRDVTTNQQINALTPSNGVSHKFVYYQMLTESFQRSVMNSSAQATLPIINKSKWGALTVVLPPKLEEQKRIVAKFDALASETLRLSTLYERKLAALEALKKSLLHQAFNGEL